MTAGKRVLECRWRDDAAAALGGGVGIVATQVIRHELYLPSPLLTFCGFRAAGLRTDRLASIHRSDYLTPYDGEQKMMQTRGKPVVVYTYRMRFERVPDRGGAA
jgi:hypothetical protein